MREKDSEFINCRALIFVAVAFFCTIVGVAKTTNGGVSGKVLYANDSLYVEVSNNSNDTVYVFDTYLKKYYGYCLADVKYLRRYNYNTDRFAISFLPIKPYLSAGLSDLIRLGDNAVVNSGSLWYSESHNQKLQKMPVHHPGIQQASCRPPDPGQSRWYSVHPRLQTCRK